MGGARRATIGSGQSYWLNGNTAAAGKSVVVFRLCVQLRRSALGPTIDGGTCQSKGGSGRPSPIRFRLYQAVHDGTGGGGPFGGSAKMFSPGGNASAPISESGN